MPSETWQSNNKSNRQPYWEEQSLTIMRIQQSSIIPLYKSQLLEKIIDYCRPFAPRSPHLRLLPTSELALAEMLRCHYIIPPTSLPPMSSSRVDPSILEE